MKKRIVFISVMVIALLIAGCEQVPTTIELSQDSVRFEKANKTLTVVAKVLDENGKWIIEPGLTWTSADPSIATVDIKGTIRSKKTGKTIMTAQAGEVKQDVAVAVEIYGSLKLGETAIELKKGETKTIDVKILDETGVPIEGSVKWKSSDESIARIDTGNTLLAVNPGSATMTVSAKDLSATVQVQVLNVIPQFDKLVCTKKLAIKGDDIKKIECKAFDKKGERVLGVAPTWASAKPEIAFVNPNGEVQGATNGKTVITATAGDKSVKVKVKVSGQ